ncbi:hypothetical protein [Polaromonas sp.]|uniref:hypothetical protein n=1 Tax=Polaromonas sp. TaxID=1869339 RepID=UPI00352BAAA1
MTASWPAPNQLDVVWCYFPYGGEPAASLHPAIVLTTGKTDDDDTPTVIVVGGTSANKGGTWLRTPGPNDFLLQEAKALARAGLQQPTLFQFQPLQFDADGDMVSGTVLGLPYTEAFFLPIGPKSTPVIGKVDLNDALTKEKFGNAVKAANLQAILTAEMTRFQAEPRKIPKPK